MPKRSCPTEDIIQPIKRQRNHENKERKIKSMSCEKTLQLLYEGAIKSKNINNNNSELISKSSKCLCSLNKSKCNYCNQCICSSCGNLCSICTEEYCNNCCFYTYDDRQQVCYSCYK